MTSRGVPIGELSPETRRRVRDHQVGKGRRPPKLGPNSPLLPGIVNEQLERSIKARQRKQAGQWFEKELDADHQVYRTQGIAVISRRSPAMVMVERGLWRHAKGKAPVDFSGPVKGLGYVVFDAKSCKAATYIHEPEQYHQLEELRDVQLLSEPGSPTIAFLLIACQPLGICYLVEDFEPLLRREPITLRTARRGRTRAEMGTAAGFDHHYPYVTRNPDLLIAQDGLIWDWLRLLRGPEQPATAES